MSARQRLINSTIALVRRHGVGSTSVAEILEDSGLARRTLYLNFPNGKPQLLAVATEVAAATFTSQLEALLSEPDPVKVVTAFARAWEVVLADSDYDAGCPIVAAALARSEAPTAADTAAAAFTQWVRIITQLNETAGLNRQDAQDLATTVVAAVEGAVIMSIAARSSRPLQRVARSLTNLIEAEKRG